MKWYNDNEKRNDVVISSRIRLARNLNDFPFSQKLSDEQATMLIDKINESIPVLEKKLSKKLYGCGFNNITDTDKTAMVERHVISPQLVLKKQSTGLLLSQDEKISIMINEEDHLRIQSITNGMNIEEAYITANKVDDILSENLDFAFHEKYGYLTSCPTNLGTGLRASYMMFLPALSVTKRTVKLGEELSQYGIAFRGTYGEATKSIGHLYQISNQNTLGRTEEEIIDSLNQIVEQVVKQERRQREYLIQNNQDEIEDKVYRSYGILKYARQISSSDALTLLAQLKLGADFKLIQFDADCNIYELMVKTQPGNLQHYLNKNLGSTQRDRYRAEFIREHLPELAKQ